MKPTPERLSLQDLLRMTSCERLVVNGRKQVVSLKREAEIRDQSKTGMLFYKAAVILAALIFPCFAIYCAEGSSILQTVWSLAGILVLLYILGTYAEEGKKPILQRLA